MEYNLIGEKYSGIPFIDTEDMKIVGFHRKNDNIPHKVQVLIDNKTYWYILTLPEEEEWHMR